MALNTLKIATEGYLKRTTKAVLIIAVAGYLNFGGTPTPPTPTSGGGGGGGYGYHGDVGSHNKKELKKRILADDEEVIAIIKLSMQCHE